MAGLARRRGRGVLSGGAAGWDGGRRGAAEELLQGRAAGKAAGLCDLRGTGTGRAGGASPGRRRVGVAVCGTSLGALSVRTDGARHRGQPDARLAGGGLSDPPPTAGARCAWLRAGRPGRAGAPGLLRLAGAAPGMPAAGRGRGGAGADHCRHRAALRAGRAARAVAAHRATLDRGAAERRVGGGAGLRRPRRPRGAGRRVSCWRWRPGRGARGPGR